MTKKDITESTNLIDTLERFSTKHPFIFWGFSILWLLFPDPIPVLDDIILAIILSLVGIKKLK